MKALVRLAEAELRARADTRERLVLERDRQERVFREFIQRIWPAGTWRGCAACWVSDDGSTQLLVWPCRAHRTAWRESSALRAGLAGLSVAAIGMAAVLVCWLGR